MKSIFLFIVFSVLAANAADTVGPSSFSEVKQAANVSIMREMKALENSKACIDTAKDFEQYNNCDYNPNNFNTKKSKSSSQEHNL